MLRFQDPLSTWGSGATSRTNMVRAENGWLNVPGGWACTDDNTAAPGGWSAKYTAGAGDETNLRLSLGGAVQEFGHAVRIWVDSIPPLGRYVLWLCDNAGSRQVQIAIQANGSLSATNANNTVLGTSSAGVITPGSFIHVELKTKIASSATGYLEVRVNNNVVLNLTGVQTKGAGASDTATYIEFFPGVGYHVNPALAYIATPIVWDTTGFFNNNFLGPKVSYAYTVDSDGTPTNWNIIGGSSTSYGAVNEIPTDGNTNCLEATSVGNITELGIATVNSALTGITALTLVTTERQTTSATSRVMVSLKSASVYANGADRVPSYPSFTTYFDTFEQDPNNPGVGTLTPSSISAMSIRLQRTA